MSSVAVGAFEHVAEFLQFEESPESETAAPTRIVSLFGRREPLPRVLGAIFQILWEHRGRPVTLDDMLRSGEIDAANASNVGRQVINLREKLGQLFGGPDHALHTALGAHLVPTAGTRAYRLIDKPSRTRREGTIAYDLVNSAPPFLTHTPFVGRTTDGRSLRNAFGNGNIVNLQGLPLSGKSELIAQAFADQRFRSEELPSALGAGRIDAIRVSLARVGPNPVLRALWIALGKRDGELEERADGDSGRDRVIEELVARAPGRRVFWFEDADLLATNEFVASDFKDLFGAPALKNDLALLESRFPLAPALGGRSRRTHLIPLGPLTEREARELLADLLGDAGLASWPGTLADEERLPGVLGLAVADLRTLAVAVSGDRLRERLTEAALWVIEQFLEPLGCDRCVDERNDPQPLATLLAMALFRHYTFDETFFRHAQAPQPPVSRLEQVGWLEGTDGQWRISDRAQEPLRRKLADVLREGSPREAAVVVSIISRFADTIVAQWVERPTVVEDSLENALSWLRSNAQLEGSPYWKVYFRIGSYLSSMTGEDQFPAAIPEALAELKKGNVPATDDFGQLLALIVAAFALGPAGRTQFLGLCTRAADQVSEVGRLTDYEVRTLDRAFGLLERRFRLPVESAALRRRVAPQVRSRLAEEGPDPRAIKLAIDWHVKSAWAILSYGGSAPRDERLATDLEESRKLLDLLPSPTSSHARSDRLALEARILEIDSVCATSRSERLRLAKQGLDAAFDALQHDGAQPDKALLLLRIATRIMEDQEQPSDRYALLERARSALVAQENDPAKWPVPLVAAAARLWLVAARAANSAVEQLEHAQTAFQLVNLPSPVTSAQTERLIAGAEALEAIAEAHSELDGNEGVDHAAKAAEAEAGASRAYEEARARRGGRSATAWARSLRLEMDNGQRLLPDIRWEDPSSEESANTRVLGLARGAQEWLDAWGGLGEADARLAALCLEIAWRSAGSLTKRLAEKDHGFLSKRVAERRALVEREAGARRRTVEELEQRFDSVWELTRLKARNEAQLQYSLALHRSESEGREEDAVPVLAILDGARLRWPSDLRIVLDIARYHRRRWAFDEALRLYRHAAEHARRGGDRRRALIGLAEAELTKLGQLPLGSAWQVDPEASTAVRGLRETIGRLTAFHYRRHEVRALQDRVALEVGALDWTEVESQVEQVAGAFGVPSPLLRPYDFIAANYAAVLAETDRLIARHYGSREAFRTVAYLYSRAAHANVPTGIEALHAAERAYLVATTIDRVERYVLGTPRTPTLFTRAVSIIAAVSVARNTLPFKADAEGKSDLLELAMSLLDETRSRSVGAFHKLVQQQSRKARDLALEISAPRG